MKTPNEFWLELHELAEAYEAEGPTPAERVRNIVEQFERMPPAAKRHVKIELDRLAVALGDLSVETAGNELRAAVPPAVRHGQAG